MHSGFSSVLKSTAFSKARRENDGALLEMLDECHLTLHWKLGNFIWVQALLFRQVWLLCEVNVACLHCKGSHLPRLA